MGEIQQVRSEQMTQQKLIGRKRKSKKKGRRGMEENIKWNEYRNEQRNKLNEYYQDQITKLEAIKREANRTVLKEKVVQKELNKVNRSRVEYREYKRNEKIQIQKELTFKKRKKL
eukprot:TRINITY_DN6180_c0_g1_i1.p1 TRINITY_DN6180_c0_g1~~TRINITY_DN6180_c0_g1_i1.p1  ORF type:complete len:115 (+),score=24.21 TRINITY_DN6180_c0_g1_i1:214-558(+)